MPVNPAKPRKIIVVHGVQVGADKDQKQDRSIKTLIDSRMGNLPLKYNTDMYKYEDINDKVIKDAKKLMKVIGLTPVGSVLARSVLDLVGDVVINLADGTVAQQIREGLKEKIMRVYAAGNPCYIVAHSLGSIYAFDVVNELIAENNQLFDRDSRKTWPVQGLMTLGSPIGLGMFKKGRNSVSPMGQGSKLFRWKNYWDRNDPVLSGNVFGKQFSGFEIAEKYMNGKPDQGWFAKDIAVDTGKSWMLAHTAYWEDAKVGDGLLDLIAN
jgi:hypothetical protein